MSDNKDSQLERLSRYSRMIEQQCGKAVRPYRADGYVNLLNRYGTEKDTTERYSFQPEKVVPDDMLTMFYEGNGLFSKIIDTPAEEAVKHGFKLKDVSDQKIEMFYSEALDELDWEETAMTAIKWTRLFGGAIAVMLINDGCSDLAQPLNWRNIQSIDDIRVYDRSLVQPDYSTMFSYNAEDPFRTRGSRLGMPEYYDVFSKYGTFRVHESRCLTFQNGILPENTSNSIYQLWGMPEYVRINRAIRDAEVAHGSAVKMLDRSIQAVYKMSNLASLLSTEQGESQVLRRLQTIDMARGLLNSITIDKDGEDYDFRTFQLNGAAEVVDTACNYLSALTSIPQTILFGRSPAGMNSTGTSDLENYYNFVQRIQKRMLRSNLRYLLSIIFQAGLRTKEIDEIPKIKVEFNPLWSLSDAEQADLDSKRATTQQTKANTAKIYVDMQAIDPSEIRRKLADSEEFDVEDVLDEDENEDLFAGYEDVEGDDPSEIGNAPTAAPDATKLPEDMAPQEAAQMSGAEVPAMGDTNINSDETPGSVGVLVVSEGKILTGTRHNDFGYGLVCGPGGHIEPGETPEEAAFRETEEEFGIKPLSLICLGKGPVEPETGLTPELFLCTEYEGEPNCQDLEMTGAKFRTLEELDQLASSLFQPFADGLEVLKMCLDTVLCYGDPEGEMREHLVETIGETVNSGTIPNNSEKNIDFPSKNSTIKSRDTLNDGGPGSGNHGHQGVPGHTGGSTPSPSARGENPPCKGFADSKSLKRHTTKHQDKYPGMSEKEYVQHAIDFLKQPCSDDVDGYATADGCIVRFNRKTGEFAKGVPGGAVRTCFIARFNSKTKKANIEAANKYFDAQKEKEGIEDEET